MYVPPIYQTQDENRLLSVVRRHPLAVLVTNGDAIPFATHLPVITTEEHGLVGSTLLGHLNRANPHWSSLREGMPAKLIFSGPSSYVTPAVYRTSPASPTWNFVSVHLEGTLRPITDVESTLDVVQRTVAAFEDSFGDGWDQLSSQGYFRDIVPGVGAFRFEVEAAHGMFKLSQEKDAEIRSRIIERFEADTSGSTRELGSIMCEFGRGATHGE
ncbi:FMN-binding negative transcriptional regulator [Kitasatospora aureofaciens]|uniref:FMN-binding negative transcriptional regulator n=1 Tax=Kitasatospora aureofaciens TaxID=1894 RepID=UPI0037C8A3BE